MVPLIDTFQNPAIEHPAGFAIDDPMPMPVAEPDKLPSSFVAEKVTKDSLTLPDAAGSNDAPSPVLIGTTENPTIHQDKLKTPPPLEKKKNGIRPRIKEHDIFKSTPKPKTTKPISTPKPKTTKPISTPRPKTPKPTKEKRAAKRKYKKKSQLNEPEQLPVVGAIIGEPDVGKKVLVAKRKLDFELEDNNSNCSRTCPFDNNSMMCCSCRVKTIKPIFPIERKRLRTSIRVAKARKRMMVPTGRINYEAFKCTWILTHSFVPLTKKRRKRASDPDRVYPPFAAQLIELKESNQKVEEHGRREKPTSVTKKQNNSTKEEAKAKKEANALLKKEEAKAKKEANALLKEVDFITKEFAKLYITSKELVPYQSKSKIKAPQVNLDPETMWISSLMHDREDDSDPVQGTDEATKKWWEEERKRFLVDIELFMIDMRKVLGNRTFLPWKGSVVDSIVGVYLTQNVSDYLSSNAFISLAARYPIKRDEQLMLDNYEEFGNDFDLTSRQGSSELMDANKNATPRSMKSGRSANTTGKPKPKKKGVEDIIIDWDLLRTTYSSQYDVKQRDPYTFDSADWDAVRRADVDEIACAIRERGQSNVLAQEIRAFLNRIAKDHGSVDLEWLRNVPPKKTKEYLLDIYGLGMKSVECLQLLTLHHHAFPVDTNVGRIVIRLGWVPLYHPLEEFLQIHLIQNYPGMDKIQAYLWPRLCHLDQGKLYELHYMLITFGKVFCTKVKPHCVACPLRDRCKHYASACASARSALPGFPQEGSEEASKTLFTTPFNVLPLTFGDDSLTTKDQSCYPIIEEPPSPKPEYRTIVETDIEDSFLEDVEDPDDIPFLNLCGSERALVTSCMGSNPTPKQKFIARLRTEHRVYALPDSHALCRGLEKREEDDPSPYLLAIWPRTQVDETDEIQHDGPGQEQDYTVPGTLLIPCRTAMRGRFPLNGTYFQVNEVFADDETSKRPISVPTEDIWNLERRTLYCGSTTTAIARGLSSQQVMSCFWEGFVCVRGFNRKTRRPKPLSSRFHQLHKSVPRKNTKKVEEPKKTE